MRLDGDGPGTEIFVEQEFYTVYLIVFRGWAQF